MLGSGSCWINCFVMGQIDDSMDGIFGALREGALTLQQGGGVGYDFSPLRPAGEPADAAGGTDKSATDGARLD